jgi:hypothetical protein
VRIPKNILGAELSEKQQEALKVGKSIYLKGMTNTEGEVFSSYIKVNAEKKKFDFFKFNPDKSKKQEGAEVKPDNAQKTPVEKPKKKPGQKMS